MATSPPSPLSSDLSFDSFVQESPFLSKIPVSSPLRFDCRLTGTMSPSMQLVGLSVCPSFCPSAEGGDETEVGQVGDEDSVRPSIPPCSSV